MSSGTVIFAWGIAYTDVGIYLFYKLCTHLLIYILVHLNNFLFSWPKHGLWEPIEEDVRSACPISRLAWAKPLVEKLNMLAHGSNEWDQELKFRPHLPFNWRTLTSLTTFEGPRGWWDRTLHTTVEPCSLDKCQLPKLKFLLILDADAEDPGSAVSCSSCSFMQNEVHNSFIE